MTIDEMQKRAIEIRKRYDKLNAAQGRKNWNASAYMSGLVGDIGDLSKLIMAKNNLRSIDGVDEKIKHELSDCLWSIFILADELNINIEKEFMKTMNELDIKISKEKV